MKILELHLPAFGPFTARHLDLSGGQHGLHLVFGANEAGKSSALRALRALLFGIPERTQDDFQHTKQNLRIGGRLRGLNGEELLCFRKKGRKDTLLDSDGQTLADDRLARLLGTVDERQFERLFGIDHERLVSGGQALLAERGREAEAIFGAGLGNVDLHAVLKQLDQEAASLFLPKASKPLINLHLTQFADIERHQREVSLSARRWDDARKVVSQAHQRLVEMDEQLAQATRQRSRLERIRRTLPNLARRARLLEQLAELGKTPSLTADFGQRREAALAQRTLAIASQSGARLRRQELQDKAALLTVREELLAEAATIDALLERLGSHRKAALDRTGLVSERAALEAQAVALLTQIRSGLTLTEAPELRPLLNRRRRVTELGGTREVLTAAVTQAQNQLAATAHALASVRTELANLPISPALDSLQRAVADARRAGDLDRAITDARHRCQRHNDDCQRELVALGLWQGGLDGLRQTSLPGSETLERFASDLKDLDDARQARDRTRQDILDERRQVEEALRTLQLLGAVPSEGDLTQARANRDRDWQRLKQQWLTGTADTVSPEVFETAIVTADEVADRLRREAQRVLEQATAQARLESGERHLTEINADAAQLSGQRTMLLDDWRTLWSPCGLTPLPPREMQPWLIKAMQLRELARQGDDLLAAVTQLQDTRHAHLDALSSALNMLGLSLSPDQAAEIVVTHSLNSLLNQAEAKLTALTETERRCALLEQSARELDTTEQRLALEATARHAELASWSSVWMALMTELGLPGDASPGDASDHLKTIDDALKHVQEATGFATRINGIDADAREFQRQAQALLTRIAPELLTCSVEESIPQLHRQLVRQREDQSRLDELLMQSRRAEEDIQQTDASIHDADAVLAELCREAGCKDPEQLALIERSAKFERELRQQLQEVDAALMSAGDGLGIDALRDEAGRVDRDAVLADLAALETRLEGELRPQHTHLLEEKVTAERKFAEMAGDSAAATLAEDAQHTLAALRTQAERYMRVKLAARLLRDTIERFRREHRDPILAQASGYFAQLTCNAFQSIETDFDDSDQHVLVGRRASGERLRVEGMSTGTRDQLYLALRLATLDQRLKTADPLPFIVDDILIQFDDTRAQATLAALAAFSTKTQVILFTHHQRVIEQARILDPDGKQVLLHVL